MAKAEKQAKLEAEKGKFIILKCRFSGGKNKGYVFDEKAPISDFSKEELKDIAGYYEEV